MDVEDVAIFHVRVEDNQTTVCQVTSARERANVCADLGYHASDLLQSNCIIWVEGPSDRIYLNHWLHTVDSQLKEGLHYSIMFYGGRLLSHLSADDPEVGEFISLRRLNRNIAILIDSDKPRLRAPLGATKRRVVDEFERGPGFAWVTKGREIENYVSGDLIEEIVREQHANVQSLCGAGQFDDCLAYRSQKKTEIHQADKLKVARAVVQRGANLDILDLRTRMDRLVEFIRQCNSAH